MINSQGQELNLSNISLGRPVPLKTTVKPITTTTSRSVVQPKQVVMKRVIAPANKTPIPRTVPVTAKQSHIMVVQKSEQPSVKLVQSGGSTVTSLPNPTKTISLQQAQEMGLITTMTKFVSQSSSGKHTLLLNKPPAKAIKIVPQVMLTHFDLVLFRQVFQFIFHRFHFAISGKKCLYIIQSLLRVLHLQLKELNLFESTYTFSFLNITQRFLKTSEENTLIRHRWKQWAN